MKGENDMDDSVGAIWEKESKKGQEYLSLVINEVNYVAFKNDFRKSDRSPAWRIFESVPEKADGKSAPGRTDKPSRVDNDIPF